MKIVKYKKLTKGRYKIYLDDLQELILYEEVILKFELLIKKEIDDNILNELIKYNEEWIVYYAALESIKQRFKSIYDIKEILRKKDFSDELIEKTISKLCSQGYLNDKTYARNYINNHIFIDNKGPFKLRNDLIKHHVSREIIDDEMIIFTDEIQFEKIRKIISKLINTNKSLGGAVLKKKIVTDLINVGYGIDNIMKVISSFDFSNNDEIARLEYNKLYRKLSKKYEGKDLEIRIREQLFRKGLHYEN